MKNMLRILTLAMLLVPAAFTSTVKAQNTPEPKPRYVTGPQDQKSKVLVVYFSVTGKTAQLAERLSVMKDYDIYRIRPQQPYTWADMEFNDTNSRCMLEMKDSTIRPAIAGPKLNLDRYKAIYIGFPIWWNTMPLIVRNYIENNNFEGKKLIPFVTCAGSTEYQLNADIKRWFPNYKWEEARIMNMATPRELAEWDFGFGLEE